LALLQVCPPQGRFQFPDALFGIDGHHHAAELRPGGFPLLLILFLLAPHQCLGELVFAAELGEALLPAEQLAHHLELKLPIKAALRS